MVQTKLYLSQYGLCDWKNENILKLAEQLKSKSKDKREYAINAFYWVRDNILYSVEDVWKASEALMQRRGNCYPKSNLLVALCRANGIPARFQFQLISGKCMNELTSWKLRFSGNIKHCIAQIYLDDWLLADCNRDKYLPGAYEWDGYKSASPHPYLIKYLENSEGIENFYKESLSLPKNPFKRFIFKFSNFFQRACQPLFDISIDETRFRNSKVRTLSKEEINLAFKLGYEYAYELTKIKHKVNPKAILFPLKLWLYILSIPTKIEEESSDRIKIKAIGEHPFNDWKGIMEAVKGGICGVNSDLKFNYEIYEDHIDITMEGEGNYLLPIFEIIPKILKI